jgi:DeoR/GlpR family transcriptional regulator of sugar metabolism
MLASERRKSILEELENLGRVRVGDLSETLSVSRMTINRDLSQLAEKGLLEKVFGGAVAIRSESSGKDGCAMCGMANRERTAFVMQCTDG